MWRHWSIVTSPKAVSCLGRDKSISDTRRFSRTPGCTRQDGLTDRLIFNMGIPIPGKDGLYIETGPWLHGVAAHGWCSTWSIITLRDEQDGQYLTDNIFIYILFKEAFVVWLRFHCSLVRTSNLIDNKLVLVQAVEWCQIGGKPLPELIMTQWRCQANIWLILWIWLFRTNTAIYLTENEFWSVICKMVTISTHWGRAYVFQ